MNQIQDDVAHLIEELYKEMSPLREKILATDDLNTIKRLTARYKALGDVRTKLEIILIDNS